jgi:hypothetical protein
VLALWAILGAAVAIGVHLARARAQRAAASPAAHGASLAR